MYNKTYLDTSLKEHAAHGTKKHPMIGLHFESGNNSFYPNHFFVERHWHHTVEIILILKGSYEFEINLEQYILNEGDIAFLNSGDLHQITGFKKAPYTTYSFSIQSFWLFNILMHCRQISCSHL